MNEELEQAIKLIEENGGFVMMQGVDEDQTAPITEARMLELEEDQRRHLEEYQQRKRMCFDDFQKMLGSKNFSVSAVDDLVYGHGLDMDDLEEMIHNSF